MDDVFVYLVNLPDGVDEVVLPCFGGYTLYIDQRLSWHGQREAYKHGLKHIKNNDHEKHDVQQIEYEAHRKE